MIKELMKDAKMKCLHEGLSKDGRGGEYGNGSSCSQNMIKSRSGKTDEHNAPETTHIR